MSALRQKAVDGSATSREINDAINKSTKVAIDSTRRIIRLCTEVDTVERVSLDTFTLYVLSQLI